MYYVKKPIPIEAKQLPERGTESFKSFVQWIDRKAKESSCDIEWKDESLMIYTLEGGMLANPGDYIICGVQKELYPCKAEIFEKTYELAEHECVYSMGLCKVCGAWDHDGLA